MANGHQRNRHLEFRLRPATRQPRRRRQTRHPGLPQNRMGESTPFFCNNTEIARDIANKNVADDVPTGAPHGRHHDGHRLG